MRISRLAVTIGLSGMMVACAPNYQVGEFSHALRRQLEKPGVTEIDLASVTELPWEELFVFGPYSPREKNCLTLQLGWLRCWATLPAEVNESENILVFRRQGNVIRTEHHFRANGDFDSRDYLRPRPILRSAARFVVIPSSDMTPQGKKWFRLEYKG